MIPPPRPALRFLRILAYSKNKKIGRRQVEEEEEDGWQSVT